MTIDIPERLRFKGIGAILGSIAGIFYASSGLFTKLLTGKVTPGYISWMRAIFMLASTIPLGYITSSKFWIYARSDYIYLFAASVDGAVVCVLQYYAFQMLSLSEAITIISSFPVFVVLFSKCFLKEVITLLDYFLVAFCLIGSVLCAQPEFLFKEAHRDDDNLAVGLFIALGASIGWAIEVILMKKVCHVDVVSNQIIDFSNWFIFLSLYVFPSGSYIGPEDPSDYILISLNGVASIFAAYLNTLSLKLDSALMFSIGKTAEIIASIFFQAFVFYKPPNLMCIFGGILVVVGIVVPSILKVLNFDRLG